MPNTQLTRKRDVSSFRMMAMGTWKTAKDPSVYGSLALEVDAALAYIEAYRAATGRKLTLTHLMAKAVATVLAGLPDANAIIRFQRIYLRKDVDIFFQVMMEDPVSGQVDLSGLTIRQADTKSLTEIVEEFNAVAARVRAGKDADKEKTRQTFKQMPGWLVGWVLDTLGLLMYTLNLDLSRIGLPRDPFGSVMITNIGSLGLEEAYAPLVPYSRVPLLMAMGAVRKVPLVDDATDALRIARVMRVFVTFDHRILDGAHAATMAAHMTRLFADPEGTFGPIPQGSEGRDGPEASPRPTAR